jgi:acyl-CoA thioesterase-2
MPSLGRTDTCHDLGVPHSVVELLDLLELEQLEVDLYRGRQPDTAMQRVFGGQVAAQALRAACHTVAEGRVVHSLHSYFLRPGDTSVPIVYDVERIRDGSSFSTRRVMARQHGRIIFYLTASYQVPEPGFTHHDAMPAVPEPERCPTLGDVVSRLTGLQDRSWEREWAALDVRYAGDSRPGGEIPAGAEPARARIWLKASGAVPADPVTNTCVLTYASDLTLLGVSLVPHGQVISSPGVMAASLDHSMWFHQPFRADEWMLYDQHSPSASGARGFALGRVFSRGGTLVASVAQEGLIRPVGAVRDSLDAGMGGS